MLYKRGGGMNKNIKDEIHKIEKKTFQEITLHDIYLYELYLKPTRGLS